MKWFLIFFFLFVTRCDSFVTLNLNEIKKESINDLLSETTQSYSLDNAADENTISEKQKNWSFPVESKQVDSKGQKFERFLSDFNVPTYEQMDLLFRRLRLLAAESPEKESHLKLLDTHYFDLLNFSLLKLSTLQDKLVLLRDVNLLSFLSSFISEINEIENMINSEGSEDELLSRIKYFFEKLCRKHHDMISKLNTKRSHFESTDGNSTKNMLRMED